MSVFLPATVRVVEEGMVEVCATMSATQNTERNFTVTLATEDGTGMMWDL